MNSYGSCIVVFSLFVFLALCGCGTTKWSDTSRTATEQLLLSYAIDHAVEKIDFSILSGKKVFVECGAIAEATDNKYISNAIRQHVATCGGLLCDEKGESEYIIELRTGAVGTDRNDLLYGIPAFTIPAFTIGSTSTGTGAVIPEIPFVKRTNQRAVCKIAVFAYHRESGKPLWCSGNRQSESRAKAWWIFGAGPINRGSIYDGTEFAGGSFSEVIAVGDEDFDESPPLTRERFFFDPELHFPQFSGDVQENAEPLSPPLPAESVETPEKQPSMDQDFPRFSPQNPLRKEGPNVVPEPPGRISRYGGIPSVVKKTL